MTLTQTVSADTYSVPFRVVKDGTTETSVADQYFQKPATVAIDGDHYVVIMTIKTTHDLGLFPVSVTDFNGQTPAISRTTQGNTDYYQYQFTATNLDTRLDGHMNVTTTIMVMVWFLIRAVFLKLARIKSLRRHQRVQLMRHLNQLAAHQHHRHNLLRVHPRKRLHHQKNYQSK